MNEDERRSGRDLVCVFEPITIILGGARGAREGALVKLSAAGMSNPAISRPFVPFRFPRQWVCGQMPEIVSE